MICLPIWRILGRKSEDINYAYYARYQHRKKEALESFFNELPFELVHTPGNLNLERYPSVRDQKDSPILATAILEDVDIFITGDKDFLVLKVERPIIITMAEFEERNSQ